MKTLWQIFAIARTEFRFGLRRGGPVVVTAVIGLLIGAGILINPIINLSNVITPQDKYTPQQWQRLAQIGITPTVELSLNRDLLADLTAGGASQSWFAIYLGLLFLPVATAGAIPADRKFGMLELLRSTTVDGKRYLAGKLLGTLAIVVMVACFPFLLFLAVLEGILLSHTGFGVPPALIEFFLKLSVLDGLPVLVFAASIGVLAGVTFRTRRGAILPGLVIGILAIFFWLSTFRPPKVTFDTFDRAAYHVFRGYQNIVEASWARINPEIPRVDLSLLGADAPAVGIVRLIGMYAISLAVIAGFFVLARQWLKRKENF